MSVVCSPHYWSNRPRVSAMVCRVCKHVLHYASIHPNMLNGMANAIEYRDGYRKAEKFRNNMTDCLMTFYNTGQSVALNGEPLRTVDY